MIHVIAMIELAPGTREEFLRELKALVPTVRAEPGCLEYGPAVDAPTDLVRQTPAGENTVVMIERWRDVAALKTHLGAPHMHAFRRRVGHCIVDTKLYILEPV